MKLISYTYASNESWGAVIDDHVIDLKIATNDRIKTLAGALQEFTIPQIEGLLQTATTRLNLAEIQYLPVITENTKIFCVGLNYEEHRVEADRPVTGSPTLFTRFAASQIGHGEPMCIPRESDKFDYEGEIAVIIGRRGRRIPKGKAWEYIAGYAPYNDGSIRDWQNHTSQWTPGKNFVATGAFGPWMTTRGEIADGQVLEITTRLNGEVMQHAKTDQLIFSIPTLINYISTFTVLEPGDVIVTGTPGGVGFKRTPPVYMRDGDIVEVEVSQIGKLVNPVKAE
jgi:2-keto-4-pentenoate hydratase/2-oxohepta-3-ene-1,7-dioic acid hydratase in catechol pathway